MLSFHSVFIQGLRGYKSVNSTIYCHCPRPNCAFYLVFWGQPAEDENISENTNTSTIPGTSPT